ncbi:hypothetical protein Tco_1005559 [Tanacetum coccineum]|uniref:Uncharacterized protein n=1 Tax=Tanacetum coccineum TaxID=301880 RepID=A0ABQ5FFP3_9ASTR
MARIMPPRRFKKKSVKRIVEKRVAKAIEEMKRTRAGTQNNTCDSGSANTGGIVAPDLQGSGGKCLRFVSGAEDDKNGKTSKEQLHQQQHEDKTLLKVYVAAPATGRGYAGTYHGAICTRAPYTARTIRLQNVTCFVFWESMRHYRSDFPELKNRNHGNQVRGTEARRMVHALVGGETNSKLTTWRMISMP